MKITKTTTHEITFSVEYFHNSEGGMDTETFADKISDIQTAITKLDLAETTRSDCDWVIVARVKTESK